MKRTNTYEMFRMLHNLEHQELKQAVKNFGGEVHFGFDYVGEDASGTERPMVCVNRKHGEGPEDVYINACRITKDDRLEILAETKWGYQFVLQHDEIEFGHISFITDLVPDLDAERKKSKNNLILETAVFMGWDMFNNMYHPDKGWGQFEVCHEIINLAKEFEHTRTWSVDDEDYDEGRYFDELIKFENKYLDEFKKKL